MLRPTGLELFKGISAAERERISRLCAERRYPRGATIFSEGDPSDSVFILVGGLVELASVSSKGGETILYILKPDEIFGELLFSEETRAFDALASTDVTVTVIPRRNFEEILGSTPTVSRNFIRLLSRRLAKAERGLAGFGHTWSYHRLARVLLRLTREHGIQTPNGTLIPLRLTHGDLAKLIGTTRETVTTQINKFKRLGLLKRDGRHFIIDRPLLKKFLHPELRATGPSAGARPR